MRGKQGLPRGALPIGCLNENITFEMKKPLTVALLGLASIALTSMDAKAAPTPAIGDLILGFRVTDNAGTGATSNLEVDLGNMLQFTILAPGQTINLTSTTPPLK
jgi:hypothetical protein